MSCLHHLLLIRACQSPISFWPLQIIHGGRGRAKPSYHSKDLIIEAGFKCFPRWFCPLLKAAVVAEKQLSHRGLYNGWPSQVDRIKEPRTIWRCDYVSLPYLPGLEPWWYPFCRLMPHICWSPHLTSVFPSHHRPNLPDMTSLSPPLSAGSTCRTGSPRTSIYNRLPVATTWHQPPSASETRRLPHAAHASKAWLKGKRVTKQRKKERKIATLVHDVILHFFCFVLDRFITVILFSDFFLFLFLF